MNNQSSKNPEFFWKTFFVGLFITLIVGIAIGYGTWGRKAAKPDVTQLLSEIGRYIETIKKENNNLKNKIRKMEDVVAKGKQAIESMKATEKDLSRLQDDNTRLRQRMQDYTKLQQQLKEIDILKKENQEMKMKVVKQPDLAEQVKRLTKENEELRAMVQKVQDVVKPPTLPVQTDQPSS